MLTSGSSILPHLQLPLLEAKVTVCCKDLEKPGLYKFTLCTFNLKPGTFRVIPKPFPGGSGARSIAKGPVYF